MKNCTYLRIITHRYWTQLPLSVAIVFFSICSHAWAGAYFEDGFLGLTQDELRAKLGPPEAVRDRKSALRVFNYYSLKDWNDYFSKLISPQNGEDVYYFEREGVEIRYSFGYVPDLDDASDYPTLSVSFVDVEFTPRVPIEKIPKLIPEFRPSENPSAPAFRSNIWLLLLKGPPSQQARFIVRERGKEKLDWYLAFQMYSLQGIPDFFKVDTLIDRMEINAQSLQVVQERQRQTHEPMLNPFSREFARRPPPPPSPLKSIPVPQYAD